MILETEMGYNASFQGLVLYITLIEISGFLVYALCKYMNFLKHVIHRNCHFVMLWECNLLALFLTWYAFDIFRVMFFIFVCSTHYTPWVSLRYLTFVCSTHYTPWVALGYLTSLHLIRMIF
tara:strand:+ start:75 stop:437 length:363 start_codon:yes stop_codon:yes gene_type:complete